MLQYIQHLKDGLDKAVAEAKAHSREDANTDTLALATRIEDVLYKHYGMPLRRPTHMGLSLLCWEEL